MKFTELENLMSLRGIDSLAEIARQLETTPQAVSNWKARDQVPHHIVIKINTNLQDTGGNPVSLQSTNYASPTISQLSPNVISNETISLSNILLTMAEQLKVILLVPFITVFLTFTYVQFIVQPKYLSSATILLPGHKDSSLGGISGLASQFGVNFPSIESDVDLSSPTLYPELLNSRTFAEKILDKEFYTQRYDKKMSLLSILTYGDKPQNFSRNKLITEAVQTLNDDYLDFDQDPQSTISVVNVTAFEPQFAKELTDVVLSELESLNRQFKSQSVGEKTTFINGRIASVIEDLEVSEQRLKEFNEQNRQISSPTLQLEVDRLTRDVEVQEGIYLTLKQQLELAKIEEVQKISIIQILDSPQVPLAPFNKNVRVKVLLAAFLGVIIGILLGFVRSYFNNSDMEERRRLRRMRNFVKKKSKDIILDRRISGIISILLLVGLPFYLGGKSQNPVFFNMYSVKLMLLNTVYVITLLSSSCLYIYLSRKKTN
jgi:uncharacterized protein involved in exopolysaccharide biosynthesis